MNRNVFFEYVRKAPFGGRITQEQVDGLTKILDEWDSRGLEDERWLAYMLATTFHETAYKMQPIREMGGEKYLRSKKYYPWVGEGLVQVTWEANHKKFGANKPGELLTWPIALRGLFDGMINGMYTGKKLGHYFNDKITDPVGARKIINGTDKDKLIAKYYENFLDSIKAAKDKIEEEAPEVKTEDVKVTEDKGSIATVVTAASGLGGLGFLSDVNNPYALAAFGLIAIVGGILTYAYFSGKLVIKR